MTRPNRRIHHLIARAEGIEVETRLRCQDDDHQPHTWNPLQERTFCHCGRVTYDGLVESVRWADRDARLVEHVKVVRS